MPITTGSKNGHISFPMIVFLKRILPCYLCITEFSVKISVVTVNSGISTAATDTSYVLLSVLNLGILIYQELLLLC